MRSDGASEALGAGGRLLVVGEADAEGGGKPWMGLLSWGQERVRGQGGSRHGCLGCKGTADRGYQLPFRRRDKAEREKTESRGKPAERRGERTGAGKNEFRSAPPLLLWAQRRAWADLPPPSRAGARGRRHRRRAGAKLLELCAQGRRGGQRRSVRVAGRRAARLTWGCRAAGVQATEWL